MQCKSLAEGLSDSEALLSQLGVLETSLDSHLHTVFPGMFQQLTSPPSPPPHTSTTTGEPTAIDEDLAASLQDHAPTAPTGAPPSSEHLPVSSSQHSTPHSDEVCVNDIPDLVTAQ